MPDVWLGNGISRLQIKNVRQEETLSEWTGVIKVSIHELRGFICGLNDIILCKLPWTVATIGFLLLLPCCGIILRSLLISRPPGWDFLAKGFSVGYKNNQYYSMSLLPVALQAVLIPLGIDS